jgi:nitrate reductase cytochrome c-type subunit
MMTVTEPSASSAAQSARTSPLVSLSQDASYGASPVSDGKVPDIVSRDTVASPHQDSERYRKVNAHAEETVQTTQQQAKTSPVSVSPRQGSKTGSPNIPAAVVASVTTMQNRTIDSSGSHSSHHDEAMCVSMSHYYREEDETIIEVSPSGRYAKVRWSWYCFDCFD